MDTKARKEVTRRWITGLWDNANFHLLEEMATADYAYRAPGLEKLRGDALKEFVLAFHTAFPDLNNTIEAQFAEGDVVVTQGTTRGTHTGPLGETPASGRAVTVPWIIITRFVGDRIAEDWEVYDSLGLMQQIGAVKGERV